MQANLDQLGGLVHPQQVMLAPTQKGVSREDAYVLCSAAMATWKDGAATSRLKADEGVAAALSEADIDALFDLDGHLLQHHFRPCVWRDCVMSGAKPRRRKAKIIYPGPDDSTLVQYFKDTPPLSMRRKDVIEVRVF